MIVEAQSRRTGRDLAGQATLWKWKMESKILVLVGAMLAAVLPVKVTLSAEPIGTAFTYQGQLKQAGVPVNCTGESDCGGCDFVFSLWDTAAEGTQVGNSQTVSNLDVLNGLFTVVLNESGQFGPDAFNGHARWLEVAVDCDTSGFTTLIPRQPIISTPYALHARGAISAVNVRDFGAVGDGETDDTATIQNATNSLQGICSNNECIGGVKEGVWCTSDSDCQGGTIFFPPGTYLTSAPIAITSDNTTLYGDGAELRLDNPGGKCLSLILIRADNVSVRGLKLVGLVDCEHPAVCTPGPDGDNGLGIIDARGRGASDRISGLRIVDNEVVGIGYVGILLWYVNNFEISGNRVENLDFAGVEVVSSQFGVVAQNHISNITGHNTTTLSNAYGIWFTGCVVHDEPRCTDITVTGNTVEDVRTWHAYDTHGGRRIAFVGNTALRAARGINVVAMGNLAPLDITVVGNVLDSGVADGTAFEGIQFSGAVVSGEAPIEYATGVISGNVVRGYGDHERANSGGIRIHTTRGVQVVGNTVIEPSSVGITLESNNVSASVTGNTIVDAWTNTPAIGTTIGIRVHGKRNTAHIGDNTIGCGLKTLPELGTCVGTTCDVNADCPCGACVNLKCVGGARDDLKCDTGVGCSPEEECRFNRCVLAEGEPCSSDEQCGDGECRFSTCVGGSNEGASCAVDADCPRDEGECLSCAGDSTCAGGPKEGDSCETDADCPPGPVGLCRTHFSSCEEGVRISSSTTSEVSLGVNSTHGVTRPLVDETGRASARLSIVEAFASSNTSPTATFKNGGGNGPGVLIQAGGGGANYAILDVQTLTTNGSPQPTSRFLVRGDGHVGIGTEIPSHPLEVGTNSSNGNGAHVTTGGVWTNGSDRNSKTEFESVDKKQILDKVVHLPITRWRYKGEGEAIHHIGPMAQDFHTAFDLGGSDKHIGTIDAEGVALAAIQGLHELVKEKDAEITAQRQQIADLTSRLQRLERLVTQANMRDGGR